MQQAAPTSPNRSKLAAKASWTGSKPASTEPWMRLDHLSNVLLADRLPAPVTPHLPAGRSSQRDALTRTVDRDLDRQHAHVHQRRPKAAGEEPDQRAQEADQKSDARNHQEPPVGNRFERLDLVAQWQQLLRDTEAETELGLPVHDRSGKPADQCAQGRA